MKQIFFAVALVASSTAFAQNDCQEYEMDYEDDLLSLDVVSDMFVSFHKSYDDDNEFTGQEFEIWITFIDGNLHGGDSVTIAPANIEYEFNYVFKDWEELDLSVDDIEFTLTYDHVRMFADYGVEYVDVNGHTYYLSDKKTELTKELAMKIMLEI